MSSPHVQVYENGSLNILDARDSDVGHYMCQASNGVGPGLSKVIKVTINGKCLLLILLSVVRESENAVSVVSFSKANFKI